MSPKKPPPTLQRFQLMSPKKPPPELQHVQKYCLVPDAAPLRAPAACTDVGGMQTQTLSSANSSSQLSPPSGGDSSPTFVEEYNEAAAARVIRMLKIHMDYLLPDRAEDYGIRGSAYSLMAEINLLIERCQMDNVTWTQMHIDALRVTEYMFESKGFDRVGCLAELDREEPPPPLSFFPLTVEYA